MMLFKWYQYIRKGLLFWKGNAATAVFRE